VDDSRPVASDVRAGPLGAADSLSADLPELDSYPSAREALPAAAAARPGLVSISTSDTGRAHASSPHDRTVTLKELRMGRVRRRLLSSASVIEDELQIEGVRYRAALVTATYRSDGAWGPRQITGALKCVKEWARRRRIWVRYVWRLEFGELHGRPHYHIVVWLPRGVTMPLWDRQGWWPHGMTNARWARRPVGYIAKYAAKPAEFPPGTRGTAGARWCGIGGLSVAGRLRALWRSAPEWVRENWPEGEPLKRLSGSWWRLGTFIELRSPWRASVVSGIVAFRWHGWGPDDIRLVS